jgi:hypothetical protein
MKDLQRWRRRTYQTQFQTERRAALKNDGAKRVEATLSGEALENYDVVRQWLEGLNCIIAEREGLKKTCPPFRLTAQEIITTALRHAASSILEEEARATSKGGFLPGNQSS